MELDTVADELYGLSLDDFILTRKVLEKQAKGANDKVLAAEIHRLPKPNAIAWLINQLVRQHNDEIQTLLALGSSMRQATATFSGDRLRELSRQQHAVIRGLVQQAEALAHASGREISAATARSLEETFYATLADSGAADAVAAGRLTTGLQSTGFSTLQTTSQQGTQSATKPPSKTKSRPGAKEGRGIERRGPAGTKIARAKAVLEAAAQTREETHATLQHAEQALVDASKQVEQRRRQLSQALEARSEAQLDRRRAKAAFELADRRAQDAHRRLTDAAEPDG